MEQFMSDQENFLKPLLDLMNKRMDTLENKIDSNTITTDKTLTQAQYTNGRVTKLEKKVADSMNVKVAKKFNLPPNVIYLLALGAVLLLVIIAVILKIPVVKLL
jgi:hypothetical protein